MTAIKLCEAEIEALQNLWWEGYIYALAIYAFALRPRMNFDSFTVGDNKNNSVSYRWIRNCLERHSKNGSHWAEKKVSEDRIKRELKKMCEHGLLRALDKPNKFSPMRFFFPLASVGLKGFQEERQRSAKSGSPSGLVGEPAGENPEFSGGLSRRSSVDNFEGAPSGKNGGSSLIPVNRNIIPNNIYNGDGCSIPKDWKPKKESVDQVRQITLCSDAELDWHIAAFVFYWLERGEARSSWDEVFIWFTSNHGLLR